MAGTKKTRLPEPRETVAIRPKLRSTTYAALARRTDVLLAKAEEAIRAASCIWSDIDSGLEAKFDEMAIGILAERQESVAYVRDAYGDRLGEDGL